MIIFCFIVLGIIFLVCARRGWKQPQQKQQLTARETLIIRYEKSPLTAEIIDYICCGNPTTQAPLEIHIYDTYVRAHKIGGVITYDFAKHNVEPLSPVTTTYDDDKDLAHKAIPQLALAAAINSLLSDKYMIYDYAEKNFREYTSRVTGEHETYYSYRSKYVVMQRKSPSTTLPQSTSPTPKRKF